MNAKKFLELIETHTLGQPTRNIIGEDSPACPAKRWQEKFIYMKENEDCGSAGYYL